MQIPTDERTITDNQFFQALNLDHPGLDDVKSLYRKGLLAEAKKSLIHYFEKRDQVHYLFDYRWLPLTPIDTDENPYSFQACLGLSGSLKDFCLYAGRKMVDHVYISPGSIHREVNLGKNFEFPIHYSFLKDKDKKRNDLNLFVRGTSFEYLYVLYHETGDVNVLLTCEDLLRFFFHTYPLIVCNTAADAARFQYEDERDVMSSGFLILTYTSMLYTRVPYEIDSELAFEILKRIWFIGIQFSRFSQDEYRPYNHHMWERGLVPFILGTMFPEIPDFQALKSIGADVVCRHVKEDFNEAGGYNEHSIAYWSGAAIGEMIYRGIHLSELNREPLLDAEAQIRLNASFQVLAQIASPQKRYPSLGDNRAPEINPILTLGAKALSHPACREVLEIRSCRPTSVCHAPLDYCNDRAGFICGKSGYDQNANYFLMSAKKNCGYTGHNHMDMLSIFLTIRGCPIIDEPDSGLLYHSVHLASPQRGFMYNMSSHNTVLAFGQPIAPDMMYADSWGVYRPDTPVTKFISTSEGMYAEAYHDAYTFCLHTRKVLFSRKNGIIIQDCIDRGNRYPADHIQRWHLAKGLSVSRLSDTALVIANSHVQVLCLWDCPSSIRIYQNELLYPDFIQNHSELTTTIDIYFHGDKEETLDYAATTLTAAFLDITGSSPDTLNLSRLTSQILPLMQSADKELSIKNLDQIFQA